MIIKEIMNGGNFVANVPTRERVDEKIEEQESELLEAMEEAKRISKDPNAKRYNSFSDALEDID